MVHSFFAAIPRKQTAVRNAKNLQKKTSSRSSSLQVLQEFICVLIETCMTASQTFLSSTSHLTPSFSSAPTSW
eukprot:2297860-Amphidinium_carterae.1